MRASSTRGAPSHSARKTEPSRDREKKHEEPSKLAVFRGVPKGPKSP